MGIAPDRTVLSSADASRLHSRALRALPLTALVLDLVVVTVTVFLAAYGRNHMLVFGSGTVDRVRRPGRRSRSVVLAGSP